MNRIILSQIKRAIKHNLEDKADQIIKSSGDYLSKRNIKSLITYMNAIRMYSISVIRYILYGSRFRFDFDFGTYLKRTGYIMLYRAGWTDHAEVVRIILDSMGTDTPFTWTLEDVIYDVIANGDAKIIRCVLEHPNMADHLCNPSNNMIERAIIRASEYGYTDIVRLIIGNQKMTQHLNSVSYTAAISNACKYNHLDILFDLLKFVESKPYSSYALDLIGALLAACSKGNLEAARCLLMYSRVDPSTNNNAALSAACSSRNYDLVRLLLDDARVDPDRLPAPPYKRPIKIATKSFEIFKMLMDDGRADPSRDNNTVLIKTLTANKRGIIDMRILELLLADRRVIEQGLDDAIHIARLYRYQDALTMLEAAKLKAEQSKNEQKNIET